MGRRRVKSRGMSKITGSHIYETIAELTYQPQLGHTRLVQARYVCFPRTSCADFCSQMSTFPVTGIIERSDSDDQDAKRVNQRK